MPQAMPPPPPTLHRSSLQQRLRTPAPRYSAIGTVADGVLASDKTLTGSQHATEIEPGTYHDSAADPLCSSVTCCAVGR